MHSLTCVSIDGIDRSVILNSSRLLYIDYKALRQLYRFARIKIYKIGDKEF